MKKDRVNLLKKEGKIGFLSVKNRFVMPPLVTNLGDEEGRVTEDSIAYYRERARGGFGLIITEVTAVCPRGKGFPRELGIWREDQIPGYRRLIDAIHQEGSKVFVQLHHAGRQTKSEIIRGQVPEAPSPIPCPVMQEWPEEMTKERIREMIGAFGDAALRAKKAGADGVEIHGAHGYLIGEFMSAYANQRKDEYGGNLQNRMRFPIEIVKEIRKKTGEDFLISFRFSYDEKVRRGNTVEDSIQMAQMLEQASVDVLNVSIGVYESASYISASSALPRGFTRYQTKKIRSKVSIPVISVGRYDRQTAEEALRDGAADFIAFGRASLADPKLPQKMMEGREEEIIPCISCNKGCLEQVFQGKNVGCIYNPRTGREKGGTQ